MEVPPEITAFADSMIVRYKYPQPDAEVMKLLREGRRIEAIQEYDLSGNLMHNHAILLFPYEFESLPCLDKGEASLVKEGDLILARKKYARRCFCSLIHAHKKIRSKT